MPVTVPSGWSLLDESSVDQLYQGLIYKFAIGDESEETVTTFTTHFRFLTTPPTNLETAIANASSLLALAGIEMVVATQESLSAPSYLDIDVDTGDDEELYALGLDGVGDRETVIYFIDSINQSGTPFNGWSLIGARPIGDQQASARSLVGASAGPLILAHEICHQFGLEHTTDTDNIMFQNTTAITNLPPDLTSDQISTMRGSSLSVTNTIGSTIELNWASGDADNDCIVGRIHQYRYVDPVTPFAGLTSPITGDLESIDLPSVTTTVRNSLATYWVSWSDNVSTESPTGEDGGDWSNDGNIVSTSLADQAANRRASAQMVLPGTISGGSIDTTPTGSPVPSGVSLLVGAAMRGLPVEGGAKRVQPFSSFALVYTATAGAWATDRREIVRLRVQTLASRLQDRLQALTYAGSGGANGTADMAGRSRPLIFGYCTNVTVQIVDPVLLTGQLHSRSIFDVTMVYDQGIEVPFSADYASYAALEAATVNPGTYATSLATGWIRLGSALGTITADVKGDNVGGYIETHSEIIRRIVLDFSPLGVENIDEPSFITYTTAQPAEMGIFFPAGDQSSVEEAIERIAFSGGAFAGQDRSGLYRVQQLAVPAMVPHWIFDDRDIIEIERELLTYGVPWSSWGVGYAKNWTVQKGGDLAAGVTQTRRTFLESEYRYAFTSNAAIALAHQTSAGAPLRASLFVEQTDAETEAMRLISFYALGRAMYRLTVKTVLFSVEIGQTIRVIFPRWNLASGRNFVVLSVADDAATRRTEMICFG